jgi:ssDNA-binding Zn-finger/Zn-ribbon topoisomerase 1
LDHGLKKIISKFGVDASLEMFEDVIKRKCPKCGGDVQTWGSEERMGHRVNTYRCVYHYAFSDDEDENEEDNSDETDEDTCDFEEPLLTGRFLRNWESSVPVTCPACQRLLDDDKWEESPTKLGAIEQTCENCGCETTINLSSNKFVRVQEISEKLNFFERESDETPPGQEEEQTKTNPDDSRTDYNYHRLSDFAD